MKHLDALAARHPLLALALAPIAGAIFVITLPILGWILLIQAIVTKLRSPQTIRTAAKLH